MKCKTCNNEEAVTGTGQCKRCWRRDYRQRNKEHIRKVSQARYLKTRDKRIKGVKDWGFGYRTDFYVFTKKKNGFDVIISEKGVVENRGIKCKDGYGNHDYACWNSNINKFTCINCGKVKENSKGTGGKE